MQRVALIGNAGGGKTTLARAVASALDLPLYHVDSVQYEPGFRVRNADETARTLDRWAESDRWVIDGFGARASILKRNHTQPQFAKRRKWVATTERAGY